MNVLLFVAGVLGVLILLLYFYEEARDRAVKLGFVSSDSKNSVARWLWRTYATAYSGQAHLLASALHLDGATVERIRAATDPLARSAATLAPDIRERPDVCFLRRMKPWIYELLPPTDYRGSRLYLDIMGATYQRQQHEPSLEQIFVSWLDKLRHGGVFGAFDILLVPKDGNPLLAARVATAAHKQLIVCKGETDRARVSRPEAATPHETDFEGLRAFLNNRPAHQRERKFRAVAIDDSCANGSQLVSAVTRFNELAASSDEYPFEPAYDVVTLFRVLRPEWSNGAFENENLLLHALLVFGDTELDEIRKNDLKKTLQRVERYKNEVFSCASSRKLLRS